MARRHLKVRAEFRPGDEEATLVVLEQTHDWNEGFGNDSVYGTELSYFYYQTKNFKVGLYCVIWDTTVIYDYRDPRNGGVFWLHFPGKQYAGRRNNTCKIPVDVWPAIKAAVKAYNEWGETQ